MMRTTHTFADMGVSRRTLEEIKMELRGVDYDHLITEEGVTLEGIRLVEDSTGESFKKAGGRLTRALEAFKKAWEETEERQRARAYTGPR